MGQTRACSQLVVVGRFHVVVVPWDSYTCLVVGLHTWWWWHRHRWWWDDSRGGGGGGDDTWWWWWW